MSQIVGGFELGSPIGRGGFARVYAARNRDSGERLAIKVLRDKYRDDDRTISRFLLEAAALASIDHPGIVKVHGFGRMPDGGAYLVMERLDGEPLKRRLQRGPVTESDVIDYSRQIALALAAAHDRQIVHRDIKPENLFLVRDADKPNQQQIKVLDFGIAKGEMGITRDFSTETGALLGTPQYMSPEQCRGTRSVDMRTDLYSLGVVMFQMATGRLPFQSEVTGEVVLAHLYGPTPSARRANPTVSAGLDGIIERCLQKQPTERYQSTGELIADLDALERGELVPAVSSTDDADSGERTLETRRLRANPSGESNETDESATIVENTRSLAPAPVSAPRQLRRRLAVASLLVVVFIAGVAVATLRNDPRRLGAVPTQVPTRADDPRAPMPAGSDSTHASPLPSRAQTPASPSSTSPPSRSPAPAPLHSATDDTDKATPSIGPLGAAPSPNAAASDKKRAQHRSSRGRGSSKTPKKRSQKKDFKTPYLY